MFYGSPKLQKEERGQKGRLKMKRQKRHWYNNYAWENLPYIFINIISKNIKIIIYVLTISFVIYKVFDFTTITEASCDMQLVLVEQKQKELDKVKLREEQIKKDLRDREEERAKESAERERQSKLDSSQVITKNILKVYPLGTYLKNKNTSEVGRVIQVQETRVITNTFCFDTTETEQEEGVPTKADIEFLSYKEYAKDFAIQTERLEQEKRKLTKEQEDAIWTEYRAMENELREKFSKEIKYAYVDYNGERLRIKGYDGAMLITDKGRRIYGFDENIKSICYQKYDTGKCNHKKHNGG